MTTDAIRSPEKSWWQRRPLVVEVGIVVAIALFFVLILPTLLSAFQLNLLGRFLALSIVALGIDLIWGYTGMLSLGHGVFFTLGGYALGMHLALQIPEGAFNQLPEFMSLYGVTELPWFWEPFNSFGFALVAIAIIPTGLAALLGYLVFRNRIRGVYFAILTQATTIIFFNFFNGQQRWFNGTNGLTNFRTLLGEPVGTPQARATFYTITVLFVVLTYFLCRWLTSGRFGRILVAIRDDESRLRFNGYNPTGYKVVVFAISAGLAGIAGALFTLQSGIISPASMGIVFSIEMVIWVAVGGRASLIGAVLGTLMVSYARIYFSERYPTFWLFFQGALFLIIVLVLPNGVVGWLRYQAINDIRWLFGRPPRSSTYPSLEKDLDVQYERQNLRN